jgi:hypothetical protein
VLNRPDVGADGAFQSKFLIQFTFESMYNALANIDSPAGEKWEHHPWNLIE